LLFRTLYGILKAERQISTSLNRNGKPFEKMGRKATEPKLW